MRKRKAASSIDDYIADFPSHLQRTLKRLRATIRAAAPDAEERISYGMPAFYLAGALVYFAAFKNHIGFFPTSSGVAAFKRDLAPYQVSKGTIRFPIGQPLPFPLVARIVKFRAAENLRKKTHPQKGSDRAA